jgi:hypothetical protein
VLGIDMEGVVRYFDEEEDVVNEEMQSNYGNESDRNNITEVQKLKIKLQR